MLAYNEQIVDSCEGYSIRAVYDGSPLALDSKVTSWQIFDETKGEVMEVYKALSFAEQRLDDLANASHYKALANLPMLKKNAKVLTA